MAGDLVYRHLEQSIREYGFEATAYGDMLSFIADNNMQDFYDLLKRVQSQKGQRAMREILLDRYSDRAKRARMPERVLIFCEKLLNKEG